MDPQADSDGDDDDDDLDDDALSDWNLSKLYRQPLFGFSFTYLTSPTYHFILKHRHPVDISGMAMSCSSPFCTPEYNHVTGFSDLIDLWVTTIKKPLLFAH